MNNNSLPFGEKVLTLSNFKWAVMASSEIELAICIASYIKSAH